MRLRRRLRSSRWGGGCVPVLVRVLVTVSVSALGCTPRSDAGTDADAGGGSPKSGDGDRDAAPPQHEPDFNDTYMLAPDSGAAEETGQGEASADVATIVTVGLSGSGALTVDGVAVELAQLQARLCEAHADGGRSLEVSPPGKSGQVSDEDRRAVHAAAKACGLVVAEPAVPNR